MALCILWPSPLAEAKRSATRAELINFSDLYLMQQQRRHAQFILGTRRCTAASCKRSRHNVRHARRYISTSDLVHTLKEIDLSSIYGYAWPRTLRQVGARARGGREGEALPDTYSIGKGQWSLFTIGDFSINLRSDSDLELVKPTVALIQLLWRFLHLKN